MARLALTVLFLIVFAGQASAWGPKANEQFCRNAVEQVWGSQALSCIDDRTAYCDDLKSVFGEDIRQQCLNAYATGVEVFPYTAPEVLFMDFENHVNYDDCPITWLRTSNEWVCSGEGNPSGITADFWFQNAKSKDIQCTQVRSFCTGAYYFAASKFPLNRVTHLKGCLGGSYDLQVDEAIVSGETDWIVKNQCFFSMMKQLAGVSRKISQHITFSLNEQDYNQVMSDVVMQAELVRNPSLTPTTSTSSTTYETLPTSTLPPPTILSTTIPTTTLPTTSTIQATTSTTVTTVVETTYIPSTTLVAKVINSELNQSLEEMELLLDEMLESSERMKVKRENGSIGMFVAGFAALIIGVCILFAVYLISNQRRPKIKPKSSVVVPPSVRRRLRSTR